MSRELKSRIETLIKDHRYLADKLTEGVWVLDAETLKFVYATDSLLAMSGYTEEEYLSLTLRDRLSPETYRKTLSALIEQRKRREQGEGGVKTLELEMIRKDGSTYWIETTAKFISDDGGRLMILGVIRDISTRKQAERKQERLILRLEDALAEKKKLLREIKVLKELLPICSGCKRIRDENGKWWPLDAYVTKRMNADLTHTICGDCRDVFYE